MVFRRFFSKDAPKPEPAEPVLDESDTPDDDVGEGEPEVEPPHPEWSIRARGLLPTGASTGSKRLEALYGSADAIGPTHFRQAAGCRVIDADGNEFVDCTMALGTVALGYNEPSVRRAVVDEIMAGPISTCRVTGLGLMGMTCPTADLVLLQQPLLPRTQGSF